MCSFNTLTLHLLYCPEGTNLPANPLINEPSFNPLECDVKQEALDSPEEAWWRNYPGDQQFSYPTPSHGYRQRYQEILDTDLKQIR